MCELYKKSYNDFYEGYKVVAKNIDTGDYYSVAIGCKYSYPVYRCREIRRQRRISTGFNPTILEGKSYGYRDEMIGRTAAFYQLKHAKRLLKSFVRYDTKEGYELVVIHVRLSDDLLLGIYSGDSVFAGRRMEILEEVQT